MSGRKQHYIPQVLLRGFLSPHRGKRGHSWVYKSGKPPYSASISDIAAERHFYSDLGRGTSATLDDRITSYESRLGGLLASLRNATDGEPVDPLVSAEVVAHLSIRAAYLREIFGFGVHGLIEGASARFSELEVTRQTLGLDENEDVSRFANSLDVELEKFKDKLPSGLPLPLVRRFILYSAREDFGNIYAQISPSLGEVFRQLAATVPAIVRDGHAKVMDSGMAPDARVFDLANLSWSVCRSATALIMPDCVAISVEKGQAGAQPYLLGETQNIAAIILPITSNQMLIGCPPGPAMKLEASEFNSHAARCSAAFFISSEDSESLRTLAVSIGSTSYKTMSALVAESLGKVYGSNGSENLGERRGAAGEEYAKACNESQELQEHRLTSFRVSFRGCANQEQAIAIAKAVRLIVDDLGGELDVRSLDAVVFAEDYASYLQECRPDLAAQMHREAACIDGLASVAKIVPAARDGSKSQVILQPWLGHALLSGEEREVRVASHVILEIISQVAFSDLVDSAFRNNTAESAFSAWDSLLYGPMSHAPAGYYAARMSADADPTAVSLYREVVLRVLEHANSTISVERFAYATHGDLGRFLHLTTGALGALLVSVAKLIGHWDACKDSMCGEGDGLNGEFDRQGLGGWVSLYGRDLRRVFGSRGQWRGVGDLSALSVHMERHLWRYMVFPWITEDGQIRVEVPYVGDRKFG